MTDVFVSYARSTAAHAHAVAEALRAVGYDVWLDDALPGHRAFAEVIDERLQTAKAVVVVWSADAARSEWVQSEADTARADHKLVQLTIDGARLPRPFDRVQCTDLIGWTGDPSAVGWRKILDSVAELVSGRGVVAGAAGPTPRKHSICVLPFENMSGDPEQEYFSDGISEDIITDLTKVAQLSVASRNTAFQFRGRTLDVRELAHQIGVDYVLEGSVRKSGGRVRITAQLLDGIAGDHVWAERYDRELTDIFALQDEISQAIVKALKLKLLPQEKQAIERRGTGSVEAYNLFLMARSYWMTGNQGDPRPQEAVERLCSRAVEIDPAYAKAWGLLAVGQYNLQRTFARPGEGGKAALARALELDPDLAEARALKARVLAQAGRYDEAEAEIAIALRLEPYSYEVNFRAGGICYSRGRLVDAVRYLERAAADAEADLAALHMLISCYAGLGDRQNNRRVARIALARAERAIAQDRSNASILETGVSALAALDERERTADWMHRALLIDPDNLMMRYNFACTLASSLGDPEAGLDMLRPVLEKDSGYLVRTASNDPDLAALRDDPRFKAMVAAAEARAAAAGLEDD